MSLIRDIHTDLDTLAERHQQLAGQRAVKKLRGKRVAEHTLAFLGSPAGLLVSAAGGMLLQRWLHPGQAPDEPSNSATGDDSSGSSATRTLLKTVVTRLAMQRMQQALAAFESGQADAQPQAQPTEPDVPEASAAASAAASG